MKIFIINYFYLIFFNRKNKKFSLIITSTILLIFIYKYINNRFFLKKYEWFDISEKNKKYIFEQIKKNEELKNNKNIDWNKVDNEKENLIINAKCKLLDDMNKKTKIIYIISYDEIIKFIINIIRNNINKYI